MTQLEKLRPEASAPAACAPGYHDVLYAQGLAAHFDDPSPIARAHGLARLLAGTPKVVYPHDRILGSLRGGVSVPVSPAQLDDARAILQSYGRRTFLTNADHFAPDYAGFLRDGVSGTLARIRRSREVHRSGPDSARKLRFLDAAEISMEAFGTMAAQYADAAEALAASSPAPERRDSWKPPAPAGPSPPAPRRPSGKPCSSPGLPTTPLCWKAGTPWPSAGWTSSSGPTTSGTPNRAA